MRSVFSGVEFLSYEGRVKRLSTAASYPKRNNMKRIIETPIDLERKYVLSQDLCITSCLCPCVAERASRRAGTDARSDKSLRAVYFGVVVVTGFSVSFSFPRERVAYSAAIPTTDNLPADPPPRRSGPSGPGDRLSNTKELADPRTTRAAASPASIRLLSDTGRKIDRDCSVRRRRHESRRCHVSGTV